MNLGAVGKVTHLAKQVWHGTPYVKKEFTRAISVRTGHALATPQSYYFVYGGRCNVNCTFCGVDRNSAVMLSREVVLRLIREARELSGVGFSISFSGGEPLIYPGLLDALALAHQLRVNFGFTTNGYLLTRSRVDQILQHDPFNINISLESTHPEINELLRPRKDGTIQTIEGIDNLVQAKRRTGSRVSLIVKPTIMDQNYRTLPDLVRHFASSPEVQISLQPYAGKVNNGFWVRDIDAFREVMNELKALLRAGARLIASDATLDGFVDYFANPPGEVLRHIDLRGRQRGCDIGYRTMAVFADGTVQFCDLLERVIGNVYEQSLKDIYYGAAASKVRQRIDYCDIDCQRTCQRPIPLQTKVRAFLRMG